MDDPGDMRISDADREAAARRLHDAVGEGRITLSELEERLDAVYAARVARDLEPPLADLPGGLPPSVTALAPVPARPPAPSERVRLTTAAGTIKRTGDWQVPAALHLSSSMGTIHLDLSEVRSLPPRIDVEVGRERFPAEIRELEPEEAGIRVAVQAERSAQFQAYLDAAAPRRIPVFEILRR